MNIKKRMAVNKLRDMSETLEKEDGWKAKLKKRRSKGK